MKIGDTVNVEYLDIDQGGVGRVSGTLGALVDANEQVCGIAIETDGGVVLIAHALIISVRPA